jgi:dinuclear metal center YbgI/SA1388 family protein
MAAKLNSIVRLLNKELDIRGIADQSRNGLQIRASVNVHKVGLAADACMDSFKRAKLLGCDLLIVHHGLIWTGQKDKAGITRKRISFLKKNHISLYAAHLPLDKSRKYGHNTHILKMLGAKPKKIFGGVGYMGDLDRSRTVRSITDEIEEKLATKCKVWACGKRNVKRIAAISGAGSSLIPDAIKKKVDLFITGEAYSWHYYDAKEGGLNVIIAGHYKTETSGVKAIGELLERKFEVKTVFIDLPTGL